VEWLLLVGALVLGFVVGRWWAIAAAIPVGIWAWRSSVPHFHGEEAGIPDLLGWIFGGVTAVAIAIGVSARVTVRALARRRGSSGLG